MTKPKSNFILDSMTAVERVDSVIDANILDKRWGIEIVRTEPYAGCLRIFDGHNDFKLVYEEDVTLSFDALFGPADFDVLAWKDKAIDVVDNELFNR